MHRCVRSIVILIVGLPGAHSAEGLKKSSLNLEDKSVAIPKHSKDMDMVPDVSVDERIAQLETSLPKLVSYELDKHGILLKASVALSLVILIIGATTAVGVFLCGCMEGVRRRRRIREWEASAKGMPSPKKYTQSFGEPDTDAETMA